MMEDDVAFRLTPLDVRRYEFPTALRGYDRVRVDDFREQLAAELERLTRLNQDLDQKARTFRDQLREFRDRDKALNDALVSAQQLRGEIREQAERESQLVLREARAEADRLVDAARGEVRRLEEELTSLERLRRQQLAQMRALAERQLAEVVAAERTESAALTAPDAGGRPSYPAPAWPDRVPEK